MHFPLLHMVHNDEDRKNVEKKHLAHNCYACSCNLLGNVVDSVLWNRIQDLVLFLSPGLRIRIRDEFFQIQRVPVCFLVTFREIILFL
jgi:hypothetical protein